MMKKRIHLKYSTLALEQKLSLSSPRNVSFASSLRNKEPIVVQSIVIYTDLTLFTHNRPHCIFFDCISSLVKLPTTGFNWMIPFSLFICLHLIKAPSVFTSLTVPAFFFPSSLSFYCICLLYTSRCV